ncbi:MFS multidrug transporter-like protein [Mollisia scopiformis]|uniref:MFS multidrug transporter-like protein n=1 Tax=Mollisia scopiformis TaxID=149040 RepID=A0A132B552_MOLSC|nr:MFS multidrug transporter-like protein [Mollisia scopiformis]KUJ07532.1 MFS multidrug transporter-like protein [Mollisia scopiformis]
MDDKPYSVFTHNEKKIIVICAGLCQFFSPISGQIYFPSLDAIAHDLHVSYSLVNLSITTYLIMQGIAPAFVGGFSDSSGRRPTYLVCFIIYMAANIGLGVQNNYAALMVLRMLQSAGGSGTVALSNAVVSDIVTSQERGTYISYISIAPQAGPSLGPIIGGLLGQYLGWHSIFWFLLICTGVILIPVALFFPETCRKVVDDGLIPPPKWSRCYMNTWIEKRLIGEGNAIPYEKRDELARKRKIRVPNPLETVKIVFTKEAGFILGYIGIVCCTYYATIALLPSQFGTVYGFNQIQIALCYLPLGCGSLLASLVRGRIIDSRYKVHAKRLNMPLEYNRRVDLSNFPIERVRLEVAVPTLALGTACTIGFRWMIQYKVNLSGPLIFLFVIGFCTSSSLNIVAVLLIDIYPGSAGSAAAANNLVRCWLGAGATSGVVPMINKIGIGWTTTFFGLLNVVFAPILWYVMKNGPKWRRATKKRKEREQAKRDAKTDVGGEKGGQ